MQEKYTKAIENLKIQFDHLYAHLDDYQALYQLQIDIIDQVIDCEIEKKIAKEKGYDSEEFRFARFIFRSFGDAIAFAYVESHNLKQLSFNLEKGNLKQDAGSIGDKDNEDWISYIPFVSSIHSILVSAKKISLDGEVWKRLEMDGSQYP